jgi:hypothetical protein
VYAALNYQCIRLLVPLLFNGICFVCPMFVCVCVGLCVCVCLYIYVYVYVCMYVCMYVCIYIYIYIYQMGSDMRRDRFMQKYENILNIKCIGTGACLGGGQRHLCCRRAGGVGGLCLRW